MRYALIPVFTLLIGSLGCATDPVAPPAPTGTLPKGWMSATTEGESWNTWTVSARQYGAGIVLEGEDWPTAESTLKIRLFIRTDIGLGEQVIGSAGTTADVMHRPWYSEPEAWTVDSARGSGSAILETLTANRVTGTFAFIASAVTLSTRLPTYRVTRGSFDIRF
jgi:hypothetical protein